MSCNNVIENWNDWRRITSKKSICREHKRLSYWGKCQNVRFVVFAGGRKWGEELSPQANTIKLTNKEAVARHNGCSTETGNRFLRRNNRVAYSVVFSLECLTPSSPHSSSATVPLSPSLPLALSLPENVSVNDFRKKNTNRLIHSTYRARKVAQNTATQSPSTAIDAHIQHIRLCECECESMFRALCVASRNVLQPDETDEARLFAHKY